MGTAGVRPTVVCPVYTPWNYWYPVYPYSFGWNLGYVSYNPWGYGFYAGRFGPWYYPYGYYDPFYGPYYPYSGYAYYQREEDDRDYGSSPAKHDLGALRIKASPSHW